MLVVEVLLFSGCLPREGDIEDMRNIRGSGIFYQRLGILKHFILVVAIEGASSCF